MYRIRRTTFILILVLGLSHSGAIAALAPPLNQGDEPLAAEEIHQGLEVLRAMARDSVKYDQYAKSLGFSSVDEAVKAQTGTLLRVYRLPLEKLKDFRKGSHPKTIIESAPPTVLVPLLVGQEIRSSFMIREYEQGKKWRIVGQGSSNFLKGRSPESLARLDGVLMIPELRLRFLIRSTTTDLILIPVSNYTLFKLRQGKEYSAAAWFSTLQPMAERVAKALSDREEEEDNRNRSNQSGPNTNPSRSNP